MSSRLMTIGIAAFLLLAPAALSVMPEIGPSPAVAAETSAAAKAALDDKTAPGDLDTRTIRQHIRALRQAMKAGTLAGADRQQAREKLKAYRSELRGRRGAKSGAQPAPKAGEMPKGGTQEAPKGGNISPPAGGESSGGTAPKTDSSQQPAANVSEADCNNLWSGANKNGDDVLTEDEAKPFVDALKASGNTGSGPTIKKPDFMDACMQGAFKNVSP